MIRDQRTMVGVQRPEDAHQTPADVQAAWVAWADEHGLPARNRQGDWSTDLRENTTDVLTVYVSGGKWIANCPGCNGGVAGWPDNDTGCCLDCGTIYQLSYPSADVIAQLIPLLAARPEQYRNFWPQQGQTIATVEAEQAAFVARPTGEVTVHLENLSDAQRIALIEAGVI